jgi:Homeodomain-like domain
LGMAEDGQVFGGEEHLDAARHPWLAADQAETLQREHHLVHARRADLEMALHVALGRWPAVDPCVGIDEGQALTLPLGQGFRGHRRTIDSSAPLAPEGHDEHTLPGRPERRRALRASDPAARGRHAARTLKRAQILLAADAGVPDGTIAQSLGIGGSTVYRTKRRFVEGNLEKALSEGGF